MKTTTPILVLAAAASLAVFPYLEGQSRQDLMKSSDIVFSGKVAKTSASTMEAVAADSQSLVVEVDEVFRKPAAVMLKAGDAVTVRSQSAGSLAVGTEAVFYTNGWIYGASLAVVEVGHELLARESVAAPTEETMERAQQQADDEALQERMAQAQMVVMGQVMEVRPVPALESRGTTMITEHSADWHEAVIEVRTALKGAQEGDRVTVRFPMSRDVQWYFAPKFQEGQTGTFILHPDELEGRGALTAPQQTDVMDAGEVERLRRLLNP